LQSCEPEVKETLEIPDQDDRNPGSFFQDTWATDAG